MIWTAEVKFLQTREGVTISKKRLPMVPSFFYTHSWEDLQEGDIVSRPSGDAVVINPRYIGSEIAKYALTGRKERMKKVASVVFVDTAAVTRKEYHYFHSLEDLEPGQLCIASSDNLQVVRVVNPDVKNFTKATKWLFGRIEDVGKLQRAKEADKRKEQEEARRQQILAELNSQSNNIAMSIELLNLDLAARLSDLGQTDVTALVEAAIYGHGTDPVLRMDRKLLTLFTNRNQLVLRLKELNDHKAELNDHKAVFGCV